MLELTDIKKIFNRNKENEVLAINGISLSVERGSMVSIMGPSGSGKSTLLHIMGCLDRPTEGVYTVEGVDVSNMSDGELAKMRNKKFGFILQQFALIEDETVLENTGIPLMFAKERLTSIDERAYEMLELLQIGHLAAKKVKTLSGGEKQRVAIARALINHPEVIFADEPTGSLDSLNTERVMDILESLNKDRKTIVIITHDPMVAERCPEKYSIVDGKIYSV